MLWPRVDECYVYRRGKRWKVLLRQHDRLSSHGIRRGFATFAAAWKYARTVRDVVTYLLACK